MTESHAIPRKSRRTDLLTAATVVEREHRRASSGWNTLDTKKTQKIIIQSGGATLPSLNEPGFLGDFRAGCHEKAARAAVPNEVRPGALSEATSLLRLDVALSCLFRVPTLFQLDRPRFTSIAMAFPRTRRCLAAAECECAGAVTVRVGTRGRERHVYGAPWLSCLANPELVCSSGQTLERSDVLSA